MSDANELVDLIRSTFREIGYNDDLLRRDYAFADFTSDAYELRNIELAAFAQEPPSYRNACFGVTVLADADGPAVNRLKALGAPQVLVVDPFSHVVHRWKMVAQGNPVHEEVFSPTGIRTAILERRELWAPDPLLRAKSIGVYEKNPQIDFFYDVALLPVLERDVHRKLDELFGETVKTATALYASKYGQAPSREANRGLFRLIFRLIAAKLLTDRGHAGGWADPDAGLAIRAVEAFYYQRSMPEPVLDDVEVQQVAWDRIRTGFKLQNLSVEALAYVYENTFVSVDTRKRYDTHATPYEIAEYVLSRLPVENLPQEERTVFEPFAGHAPFLTAALGRLRGLLPPDTDRETRHDYLVRMLRGLEIDAFAKEVSYASLILADYPNSNGWQLDEGDVFTSPDFAEALSRARVVVCNPPYGDFNAEERARYVSVSSPNKAVEALRRVMEQPPEMLGFLLPRPVANGQSYRALRQEIARRYAYVEIVALPDVTFRHSGIDTALLIAHGSRTASSVWRSVLVRKADYEQFIRTGVPSWEHTYTAPSPEAEAPDPMLWRAPLLQELVDATRHLHRLESIVEIHRGVEYTDDVKHHVRAEKPRNDEVAFYQGLHRVRDRLAPFWVGRTEYLEIHPSMMRGNAHEHAWEAPKVIANAARVSRGVWTVTAAVDRTGLYCTQNFHGIWPRGEAAAEVIAAIVNGPLANAWITWQRGSQRHNTKRILNSIPLPLLSPAQQERIVELVRSYEHLLQQERGKILSWDDPEPELRNLLVTIDETVLDAYDLPEGVRGALIESFVGHDRPGAPWFRGHWEPKEPQRLEARLRALADLWADETKDLSSYTGIVQHPIYQHVIRRFGRSAVPFLLSELSTGRLNWVWALRAITGQEPVAPGDAVDIQRVAESWVRWGKDNGF
jgi:type I restriction-modification system DNA methylase subunit